MAYTHENPKPAQCRGDVKEVAGWVGDVRKMLAKCPWAFARDREAAEAIAASGNLGPHRPDDVREMLERAGRIYGSTRRRLEEWPLGAAYVERASLPGVPAAAREACRYLTALDADRAQEPNRRGWGSSTTFAGHLLAGMEAFGLRETVYALELVHKHRRQLPPGLRATLFAGAGAELAL